MKPGKVLSIIIVVAILGGAAFFVSHRRSFHKELAAANALYEQESREKVREARKAYVELRAKGVSSDEKRFADTGIASCDATDAWYGLVGRFHKDKYDNAMALMRKAKEMTGDPSGMWAERMEEAQQRCETYLAPSLEELGKDFAAAKQLPLEEGLAECELLYRNRRRWRELGLYVGDKELEALFGRISAYLSENYPKKFKQAVAAARALKGPWRAKDKEWLKKKAEPLRWLTPVSHYDKARWSALKKEYAADLEEASRAMEAIATLMTPPM